MYTSIRGGGAGKEETIESMQTECFNSGIKKQAEGGGRGIIYIYILGTIVLASVLVAR